MSVMAIGRLLRPPLPSPDCSLEGGKEKEGEEGSQRATSWHSDGKNAVRSFIGSKQGRDPLFHAFLKKNMTYNKLAMGLLASLTTKLITGFTIHHRFKKKQ